MFEEKDKNSSSFSLSMLFLCLQQRLPQAYAVTYASVFSFSMHAYHGGVGRMGSQGIDAKIIGARTIFVRPRKFRDL